MEFKTNKLLLTLQCFSGLYANKVSIDVLVAGLPFTSTKNGPEAGGSVSVELFTRAATRAGFTTNLIERELSALSELVLPCILLLKDDGACILEQIDKQKSLAKVIHSDIEDGEIWISLDELEELYLGYAYLLKKQYQPQKRSLQLISQSDGHWFWSTVAKAKSIYVSVIVASVLALSFLICDCLGSSL